MKKSSRDYRKSQRKKWLRLNKTMALSALCAMDTFFQMRMIKADLSLHPNEKAILITKLCVSTAENLCGIMANKA